MSDPNFPTGVPGEYPAGTGAAGSMAVPNDYTTINGYVRGRLQLDTDVLPDALLNPITAATIVWLEGQYPCMALYADLSGSDLTAFNYGAALLIAAKCRQWLPKASSVGEMISYSNASTRYGYARELHHKALDVLGRFDRGIEMQWEDEAWLMLRQVACIGAAWTALKAQFTTFALAGNRRRKQALGYYDSRRNPLYDLRIEELIVWEDVGRAI